MSTSVSRLQRCTRLETVGKVGVEDDIEEQGRYGTVTVGRENSESLPCPTQVEGTETNTRREVSDTLVNV